MPDPLILSLETATTNCSVALSIGCDTLDVLESDDERYMHAERLHTFIRQLLERSDYTFGDLSAIAVGIGPGSYTGLRIGLSAAKGLAYALDIPLIGIPTLEILARGITTDGLICPVLDARRMEVYSTIYDGDYNMVSPMTSKIVTASFYTDYISGDSEFVLVGTGVDKCHNILNNSNIRFESRTPSAKYTTDVACKKFHEKTFEDTVYCQPLYLKEFGEK